MDSIALNMEFRRLVPCQRLLVAFASALCKLADKNISSLHQLLDLGKKTLNMLSDRL